MFDSSGDPLRILLAIDSLNIGGAETLALSISRAARTMGHEVMVAYFTPGPIEADLAALGVETRRISRRGLKDPRAPLNAFRLIRSWRPDVVHSHLTKSDLVFQPAARFAGVRRRLSSLHNTDPWRGRRLPAMAYCAATAGCHAVIAVSQSVADHAIRTASAQTDRIIVVDNGVAIERFDASVGADGSAATLGLKADGPVFAIVGRLEPQKDHETFLTAARAVADALPNAGFIVVGDGTLRESLESRARELGLGPERLVFTGLMRDMPSAYRAADVVVFSSAWEGLPVALLEAMASRRPIAATAAGSIPDIVEDGISGLISGVGDAGALARSMIELGGAADLRARMGAAGRRVIEARYSETAMLHRLFALYRGVEAR
jgi:glycosyltransferase involved in cell wall biosynthesis